VTLGGERCELDRDLDDLHGLQHYNTSLLSVRHDDATLITMVMSTSRYKMHGDIWMAKVGTGLDCIGMTINLILIIR